MAEERVLDLNDSDLNIVLDILQAHVPDRPVFVFGSRVTGRAQRRSDLDLAIGGGPFPRGLRSDLLEKFDESDLPITVDVVEIASASETFLRRIQREWLRLDVSGLKLKQEELAAA